MMKPLTLAVGQPRCTALDVEANARAHAELVRAARARIVLFPEMSLTGYELDAPLVTIDDPRLEPLVDVCAETGTVALAGAPVLGQDGKPHIVMLAVQSGAVSVAYEKLWLGGDEVLRFSPGSRAAVLEVDGWRLGLAICKDTGIPQHWADTAALGIDVYAAGVLEFAEDAEIPEQRARKIAAEYGVWVAMASFAGPTGGGYTNSAGGSAIWAPDGRTTSRAGAEAGAFARTTLST